MIFDGCFICFKIVKPKSKIEEVIVEEIILNANITIEKNFLNSLNIQNIIFQISEI